MWKVTVSLYYQQYLIWAFNIKQKPLLGLEGNVHLNFITSKYSRAYCMAQTERGGGGVRQQLSLSGRERGSNKSIQALHVGLSRHNSAHKWSTLQERPICNSRPLKLLSSPVYTHTQTFLFQNHYDLSAQIVSSGDRGRGKRCFLMTLQLHDFDLFGVVGVMFSAVLTAVSWK